MDNIRSILRNIIKIRRFRDCSYLQFFYQNRVCLTNSFVRLGIVISVFIIIVIGSLVILVIVLFWTEIDPSFTIQ